MSCHWPRWAIPPTRTGPQIATNTRFHGNLITSNWQGLGGANGTAGIQVIEFNPAGDVVWFYKQDPMVFSSIQGIQVIDGMDPRYLHAQEISADSTWQPVIPTP